MGATLSFPSADASARSARLSPHWQPTTGNRQLPTRKRHEMHENDTKTTWFLHGFSPLRNRNSLPRHNLRPPKTFVSTDRHNPPQTTQNRRAPNYQTNPILFAPSPHPPITPSSPNPR